MIRTLYDHGAKQAQELILQLANCNNINENKDLFLNILNKLESPEYKQQYVTNYELFKFLISTAKLILKDKLDK